MEKGKKRSKKPRNSRRWTETELSSYAQVLGDPENAFGLALEKLALKKSANNEVFDHIQKTLIAEMEKDEFKTMNAENFKGPATKLELSIEKLRQKYKWFKTEWTNITNRAKHGSGLEPEKEPNWYKILDPVFSETHKPLNLISSAAEISEEGSDISDAEKEDEPYIFDDDEKYNKDVHISSGTEQESIDVVGDEEPKESQPIKTPTKKKLKVVLPPHKKCEKIKSTKHGLSAIARGINASIAAQNKRFEQQLKENKERETRLLEFRAIEAEKDRQHELRMAQLLMSSRQSYSPSHHRSAQQFSGWRAGTSMGNESMSNTHHPTSQISWPDMANFPVMSRERKEPYQPSSPGSPVYNFGH